MTLLVGSIFHMTRKIVSEMTYNVSMGTLNPTIPYHLLILQCCSTVKLLVLVQNVLTYTLYYHVSDAVTYKLTNVWESVRSSRVNRWRRVAGSLMHYVKSVAAAAAALQQ